MDLQPLLRDKYERVKLILERAEVDGQHWNATVSALHTAAKAGEVARLRAEDGSWLFALLGTPVAPPPPPPRSEDEYPSWARRPVWTSEDGYCREVYAAKEAGHKCLWTCNWVGLGPPHLNGYAIEDMTNLEKYAELADIAARGGGEAAGMLADLRPVEDDPCWETYAGKHAGEVIRAARPSYPEAVAPWHIVPEIKWLRWRPGWEVILPKDESISKDRAGVWRWFHPGNPKGVPLCDPLSRPAPSATDLREADAARRKMRVWWNG